MTTSMSIIIFFVAILSVSAISLAEKSDVEACIRKNMAQSLSPLPSNKPPKIYHFGVIADIPKVYHEAMEENFCRDEGRIVMYYLKLNGKFPFYYVKALCNVLGDDDHKVKEYVIKKWLNSSKTLIDSLSCASL